MPKTDLFDIVLRLRKIECKIRDGKVVSERDKDFYKMYVGIKMPEDKGEALSAIDRIFEHVKKLVYR